MEHDLNSQEYAIFIDDELALLSNYSNPLYPFLWEYFSFLW